MQKVSYQYFPFSNKMTKCEIKTLDKDYKSKSYFKKPYAVLFRFFQLKSKFFICLIFFLKMVKKNCHNNITQTPVKVHQ